jgi:hypothetical protein
MFANVSNYEMKMPKRYVELSEEEMEYDGGWIWSAIIAGVGLAITIAGVITNNDTMKTVGMITTAIGIASTGIGVGLALNTLATSASTTAITNAGYSLAVEATLGSASNLTGVVSTIIDAKK